MTDHPRPFPRSPLQRTLAFPTESWGGVTKARATLKQKPQKGTFEKPLVMSASGYLSNPQIWDGDRDRETKPTWLAPATHQSRLQPRLEAAPLPRCN